MAGENGAGLSSTTARPWRLSPVKGWDTAEEARDAAHKVLDGVGAHYLPEVKE